MQLFDFVSLAAGFAAAVLAGVVLAPEASFPRVGGVALGCAIFMRLIGALPAVLAAAAAESLLQRLGRPEGERTTAVSTVRWLVLALTAILVGVVAIRWLA